MTRNVLSVAIYGQRTDAWCWAACTEMISAFLGTRVLQGDSANFTFGQKDCVQEVIKNIPPACVCGAGFDQVKANLEHWHLTGERGGQSAPTLATVKKQIDGHKPILFSWRWSGKGGGGTHAMVLTGYDDGSSECPLVHINDPWGNTDGDSCTSSQQALPGDEAWMPYAEWVSAKAEDHQIDEYTLEGRHEFGDWIYDITNPTAAPAALVAAPSPATAPGGGSTAGGIGGPTHAADPDELAKGLLPTVASLTGLEGGKWQAGDGIPIYTVPHSWIEAHTADNAPIHELTTPSPVQLLFPVYRDGTHVSAITVVKRHGTWQLKSIGRQSLASSLVAARDQHAEQNKKSPSDYVAIHIPSLYHAFIAHRHEGDVRIVHTRDHAESGFLRAVPQSGGDVMKAILRNGPPRPAGLADN